MNKKRTIIIVVVVALLAAGAALYFLLPRADSNAPEPQFYYPLEGPFVTNVKDSGKLFKATVVLVATDKDLSETVTEKQYLIRDQILFILRDLTEQDICQPDIQEQLRELITQRVNEAMETDVFKSVVFGDFVMQ